MKALILSAIIAITLVSCNQKNKETENNTTETSTSSNELFSCSMHPEITGKKGEKCSKCGMELTEPVLTKKQEDVNDTITKSETIATEETKTDNLVPSNISYLPL